MALDDAPDGALEGAAEEKPGEKPEVATKVPERLDEDGLPLDRDATLDDVRSESGSGRTIAIGCFVLVVLLVLAFWVVRGGLLH